MAKLKAPLMSLGAQGQLGKALVYFGWKGINVVREYVIPANPRTTLQITQRGYLTDIVDKVHAAQGSDTHPLTAIDIRAFALLASVVQAATTWFNQVCRDGINQLVAGLREAIFTSAVTTPGADQLTVEIWNLGIAPTAGKFWYGTTKTALINSVDSTPVGGSNAAIITLLTTGVKYFWQFRPTAPASLVGTRSGIYYGYPI